MAKSLSPSTTTPRPAPWRIHFFQRPIRDDPNELNPGREFLEACPEKVRQMMLAVLTAVAEAPPPMFSGGGKWEAMHDDMKGYYEIRVDGPKRHHYRLFCLLEHDDRGKLALGGHSIVIIAGKNKAFRTLLSAKDYGEVRALGDEYKSRAPRSVAR
jgi:Txe/YoeB family toxin of Txe-Axe toxin-antitoxin module